jgi:hypothetical protein
LSLIADIDQRVQDELDGTIFFHIPELYADYVTKPTDGWDEMIEAFPSSIVNIEEASKCLALDRGTACVFHLMRVMESALRVLAKALGILYAPSWESYLTQIDSRVQQKYKKKGIKWKRDEPFFRDASAHLHSVKAAWRNPTMHIVRDYTPEQAEEIYGAVRTFVRHLATQLHE